MRVSPLVSVVIPARNSELTLRRSVNSVLEQEYSNIEVIIAVNGSTDDTLGVAKSFNDSRVRVIESQPGIVPALNSCLKISRGKYIARQDADDEWLPGKIIRQIEVLESDRIDVLGTQMIVREKNLETATDYPQLHEDCIRWLFDARNPIGHPSVVFRSAILEKVGGYWEAFPFAEDMDLWMRMIPHVRFGNLSEKLNVYNHVRNPMYDVRVPRAVAQHYHSLYGQR